MHSAGVANAGGAIFELLSIWVRVLIFDIDDVCDERGILTSLGG